MIDVEMLLRAEWWSNHGCPLSAQYGDDGEMQCGACIFDFKRTPIEMVERHVMEKRRNATLLAIAAEQARTQAPATDHLQSDEWDKACCEDVGEEYGCTRKEGHAGRCEYFGPHGFHHG